MCFRRYSFFPIRPQHCVSYVRSCSANRTTTLHGLTSPILPLSSCLIPHFPVHIPEPDGHFVYEHLYEDHSFFSRSGCPYLATKPRFWRCLNICGVRIGCFRNQRTRAVTKGSTAGRSTSQTGTPEMITEGAVRSLPTHAILTRDLSSISFP